MKWSAVGQWERRIVAEELYATLKTNQGDIEVRLLPDHAPKTVKNFVELARGERKCTDPETGRWTTAPLYDGTVFHRVIEGFLIQGGDPLGNGSGGPGYKFADEFHPDLAFTKPYLLAMANSGPCTNGSQFFITLSPTTWLTGKHTVFGEVTNDAGKRWWTPSPPPTPILATIVKSVTIETR
ncbi:peptidylprolyl isomerase [Streptomyces sp. NPDC005132]|uniref:peptidylprolyl isomerase n=1 Tax=Streptomyces sp. NPDC005132 TaxID=3154294 RepID=UPI0033B91A07